MKAIYKLKPLPKSLGEAFLEAVKEADYLYNSNPDLYAPQSANWHNTTTNPITGKNICEICLAGALIANAKVPPTIYAEPHWRESDNKPHYFNHTDSKKLMAIDSVRNGEYERSCELWYNTQIDKNMTIKLKNVFSPQTRHPIEWNKIEEWDNILPLLKNRGQILIKENI